MRKFKLRNNVVIEEWVKEDTCYNEDGYMDDYKIIEYGDLSAESIEGFNTQEDSNWICFLLGESGFPMAAGRGNGFDMMEELTE